MTDVRQSLTNLVIALAGRERHSVEKQLAEFLYGGKLAPRFPNGSSTVLNHHEQLGC